MHDPFLLKDMEKAVKRILFAIEKKEKIIIYSDYDCDGIPGGVVLHDFFKKIGYTEMLKITYRTDTKTVMVFIYQQLKNLRKIKQN